MIPQCSAGFSSWERYADHYNSTHQSASGSPDSRPVIGWCTYPHCGRPFCSWEEHVLHQRMCHANRAQVDAMCSLCLQMEPVGGLPGHLQLHRKGDVACPLCSARFVDGDVSSHMTQFHHVRPDGSVPAVLGWCTKSGCGSSFCSWEDYVQHNIHQHSMVSDPALVCHLCLRQHGNLAEAKEHIKEHSNASTEPFKCEMCPARFFNFRHRSSHMRRFHRHNC
ncbi:GDNF-inducible zinc finger protein 1-like [Thrips palmi]|uniref:GDNF-inducible zinc finger protein 1-like n=1 Tax=Thrips palmi TaxID=161013 RepID=A0A6P9A7J7_THRPL|nr:GDNF-inducible zinc finger protein 1-like [Thrips palmi]